MTFQIALFPPRNAEGIKETKLSGTMEKRFFLIIMGFDEVQDLASSLDVMILLLELTLPSLASWTTERAPLLHLTLTDWETLKPSVRKCTELNQSIQDLSEDTNSKIIYTLLYSGVIFISHSNSLYVVQSIKIPSLLKQRVIARSHILPILTIKKYGLHNYSLPGYHIKYSFLPPVSPQSGSPEYISLLPFL